ncbi:MAG TPA: alpha/beta hydrolase [Thermoanaerobaculia bacterium]|nr:alpha/beta hydrolase [Thermoanaerobaculia bacterium]
MKLVMVHGRSQAGKDPAALKKEWLDAFGYGLLRAEKTLPPATVVELPFYGDELERLVQQVNTPLAIDANAKGTDTDVDSNLRGEILEDLAAAIGVTRGDIEREYAGQPLQRGPANWEWVHAILRAVDRVPGVNSSAIDTFTRDVYVYLTFPGVRTRIDGIVAEAIGEGPCVVAAHSLGSVVAYNVLLKRAPAASVPRFITVGCPLGVRAIQKHLDTPLRSPGCVRNWFNAYDNRDVVALIALDARGFNVTPPIENKSDVLNFTDNRHGIAGYLADPIVAAKVAEFL